MVDGRRLTVEYWPLKSILPYAANARTHPEAQLVQLVESMREFGFTQPCLVDDKGELIAGHGRLVAAERLGLDVAPVIRLGHLTPEQARAYRLADNRIALNSEWDEALLAAELAAIQDDFDLEGLGFDAEELAELLPAGGDAAPGGARDDEDEAPDPPPVPATRLGDVWLCGPHRVVCGDSTDKAAVEAAVGQETPHLMVTDPPYGVEYDADWRNEAKRSDGSGLSFGARAIGRVLNDDKADWRDAWKLFPGEVAYVWHAGKYSAVVHDSLVATNFEIRSRIIWGKNNFAIGRGDYHWKHEPCWYAVRKGGTGHWQGSRTESTVWDIPKPQKSETGHSTQKPVECMRRPIVNNSVLGDAVYDPFLGSGTTVIAAETEGRRCFGIELNPAYVDVIVKRWQHFTGKAATLQGDGRSFDDIAGERLAQAEAA